MIQKTIQSNDLSVEKVFEDFYLIPNYQREYKWTEKQVSELLTDVYDEFRNLKSEYFLGTIVVCSNETDEDSGNIYEVIDGQQRLTTIFILFCVIENYLNQILNTGRKEYTRDYICSPYTDLQGERKFRYKVELLYQDATDLLIKFADGENVHKLKKRNKGESFQKLINAYTVIENFIIDNFDKDNSSIKKFHGYFIKKVKLARVKASDLNHALTVFETINNRGLGLDSMDLLKNLLFKQVKEEEYKKISGMWKNIKDELDQINEKPMNFLKYFILSQYDVSRDEVQSQEYEWLLNNDKVCKYKDDPIKFIEKLFEVAKVYVSTFQQKNRDGISDNQYLSNIKYLIPNARQHIILLLAAIDYPESSFQRLCFELENLLFLYTFLNKKTNELEKTFIDWSNILVSDKNQSNEIELNKKLINFIKAQIEPLQQQFSKEFISKFKTINQLDFNSQKSNKKPTGIATKKTKYILGKLSQYLQLLAYPNNGEYLELKTFTQGSIEIEHILPQDLKSEPVKKFKLEENKQITDYIYSFGNLCLLAKSLNSSNQNHIFEIKKDSYRESKFLLTKVIVEKPKAGKNTLINKAVEDFDTFEVWDSKSIIDRQEKIASLAFKVWYENKEEFFNLLSGSSSELD
ncbi:MAG: DUF262 domain-containing protein [Limnoraphis robusta]